MYAMKSRKNLCFYEFRNEENLRGEKIWSSKEKITQARCSALDTNIAFTPYSLSEHGQHIHSLWISVPLSMEAKPTLGVASLIGVIV